MRITSHEGFPARQAHAPEVARSTFGDHSAERGIVPNKPRLPRHTQDQRLNRGPYPLEAHAFVDVRGSRPEHSPSLLFFFSETSLPRLRKIPLLSASQEGRVRAPVTAGLASHQQSETESKWRCIDANPHGPAFSNGASGGTRFGQRGFNGGTAGMFAGGRPHTRPASFRHPVADPALSATQLVEARTAASSPPRCRDAGEARELETFRRFSTYITRIKTRHFRLSPFSADLRRDR